MAAARKECDRLYDDLTYLIEAFSMTADNPEPYEAFIKQWNGTLKIYQDMLDRKSGTGSGGTTPDNGGTTPDNGGGTTPDNGGDTPQPDNGGDTPTPNPDPVNPQPDNGGGDNPGGGGDDPGADED